MRDVSKIHELTSRRAIVAAAILATLGCAILATSAAAQSQKPVAANAASSNGTPASIAPNATMPPNYSLGSGDHVRVTVFGQQEMTGEYLIDGSGDIAFPLIGRLHVGGMTGEQVAQAIENKLSPDYLKNPHVSVEVLTYRPFYIVGEVKSPGSYPYVSGMTVLNAIALAGGYTYRAREDSFYLTRNDPKGGGKEKVDADSTSPVLPGDIITVRERYF